MSSSLRSKFRLRRVARWMYRPAVLAGMAIVIGLFIAAPHVRRLAQELRRQPIYLVEGGEVQISQPHPWVRRDFFEQAVESGGLEPPLSVVDPSLVRKLRTGLEASPWIEQVNFISASLQDGVRILVTYREPVAMVQTLDGLFPVDRNGVVLPAEDFSNEAANSFPRLMLFDVSRPAAIGSRWRDERVLLGARLAATLHPFDRDSNRPSIWQQCRFSDIRPADGQQGVFECWTQSGSRVVWGHVGTTTQDVEPTDDIKVGRLEHILAQRRSLDEPAGPYLIDLRRTDIITREPLATSLR